MAPKKAAKPGEADAAAAEAQRLKEEEDRKKKEAEEEAKLKAEEEQRRRDEEEQRRREEEERRREEELRRSKEEEERRIREKEREIQQIQLLEEKDKEINDLKEKVYAFNRSFASVQNDLEAETHRSAQLTNELEVCQMKLIEVEGSQESKEKQWASQHEKLREENAKLTANLDAQRSAFDKLVAENEHLKARLSEDTEALRTEVTQIKSDKDRDDTENTVLMKLLHTEVEKYKQEAARLQTDLERKERDDVKNTIMLGLLNSQIDSGKEENRRLNDMIDEYRRRVDALETKLDAANGKLSDQTEAYDTLQKETTTQRENLLREIEVHKSKVESLLAQVAKLNEELDTTKVHYQNYQANADRKDKDNFERNVMLKAELEHTKAHLAMVSEERKKESDESFARNTQQTAEIDSLKIRIQKLQENADKREQAAFETTTLLKSEVETLKTKINTMSESQRESDKSNFEKITALKGDLETEKSAHVQTKHIAERKEKEYFEQLTRMTAEHESLNRQVAQLQNLHEKRDKEYVDNTVFLNAEKETLKNKVAQLTEQLNTANQQHQLNATKQSQEISVLKKATDEREATLRAELAAETEKLVQEREQAETLQRRVHAVETEMAKKDKDNLDRTSALKAEIQGLRNEVEAGKQTIEKLEGSIAENYNFKILAEQNEMLKADLQSYKNQVANLNNTIATMKIETDILDNYKTKVLQEQNEQYVRRIAQLEKEQRMVAPLVNEMVNTLQRHGLTTSLQADIDQYRAQVARSSQMALETSSSPKTASSMGRKELPALTQAH